MQYTNFVRVAVLSFAVLAVGQFDGAHQLSRDIIRERRAVVKANHGGLIKNEIKLAARQDSTPATVTVTITTIPDYCQTLASSTTSNTEPYVTPIGTGPAIPLPLTTLHSIPTAVGHPVPTNSTVVIPASSQPVAGSSAEAGLSTTPNSTSYAMTSSAARSTSSASTISSVASATQNTAPSSSSNASATSDSAAGPVLGVTILAGFVFLVVATLFQTI